MTTLLDITVKRIEENLKKENISFEDFTIRYSDRKIYRHGGEFDEFKVELIVILDTGDYFNKTIRFDLNINSYDSLIRVRRGYGLNLIRFERKEYREIIDYISREIMEFSYKDMTFTKQEKVQQII